MPDEPIYGIDWNAMREAMVRGEWMREQMRAMARAEMRADNERLEAEAELFLRMGFAPEELVIVSPPWWERKTRYVVPDLPSAD